VDDPSATGLLATCPRTASYAMTVFVPDYMLIIDHKI
jgi:hypothetical protein